jgi:hypothetical protein
MAEEQVNPFETQPSPKQQQFAWGGMPTITPQGGAPEGGSFFQLSPEAMQMMWAPQPQAQPLMPQPQVPQINPLL